MPITRVADWPPARAFPLTYPGRTPDSDYVLLDDRVHPIRFVDDGDPSSAEVLGDSGRWSSLDHHLLARGHPGLADRFPIATYGANRNPGTLAIKLDHYDYRSPGQGRAIPVLRGWLRNAEALAGGLSSQGYLFADLQLGHQHFSPDETPSDHDGSEAVHADRIEVWINLVDDEVLRILNESEGVGSEESGYLVARLPTIELAGTKATIDALGYVTGRPMLTLPRTGRPIAFAAVPAEGRTLPALTQVEMFDELLDQFELREQLPPAGGDQAERVITTLNEHWWHRRNGGDPQPEAEELLALLGQAVSGSSVDYGLGDRLASRGRLLSTEQAFNLGPAEAVGNVWTANGAASSSPHQP